jgi:Zn-dependent protease/CBS domain-containing protein
MGGSIRLGRVLDIEVRLDYSWFLVFFFMVWALSSRVFPGLFDFGPAINAVLGTAAALLLFASVLVHEFSHALVARRHGIEVSGITLFLFGGVAQIKGEPESPKAEFQIAAVGPATSFGIGFLCLALAWLTGTALGAAPLAALFTYLGMINIILALFNLVPGFPLDGGRILRSAIWHLTGNLRKATRWSSNVGQTFAWLLIGYGLYQLFHQNLGGLWSICIGWFLNNAAESAYQQLLMRRALQGVPIEEAVIHDVPEVDAELRIPEFVDRYLLRYDYSAYPVTRDGELVGVVTVEDVRSLEREYWGVTAVGSIAHAADEERIIFARADAWTALTQMIEADVPRLLVMQDGRPVGFVSRESILRLIQRRMRLGLDGPGVHGAATRRGTAPRRDRGLVP